MGSYVMNKYEVYKPNVDVVDKFDIKNDLVARSNVCRSKHVKLMERKVGLVDVERPQPLAAAVIGVNNTGLPADTSVPRAPETLSNWTDIDEQHLYVGTKPNCYLIIGKPGCGSYSLGEAVAQKLHCIHICPRNILLDEIDQNSPTGKCLDFNMKHYRECDTSILMKLMKKKIESPAVLNQGYVLSGLPLVNSDKSEICLFKSLYSEEALEVASEEVNELLINLKKKKKKKKPTSSEGSISSVHGEGIEEEDHEEEEHVEEAEEEEEDKPIAFPKFLLNTSKDLVVSVRNYYRLKKEALLDQVNMMLKLELKPDVIIYMTSPDEDLVTKKCHKYLDYSKHVPFTDPILSTPVTEQRWPTKYSLERNDEPFDEFKVKTKYCVRQPFNFEKKSVEQLCTYRNHVLPFLKMKVKSIHPKLIIKVDARTSTAHMMHHIYEQLLLLPLTKPVHIPEPLYLEDPSEDVEEFWKSVEEISVAQMNDTKFNYCASLWYNRCPVELRNRITIKGKPKYAVAYLKHVFLLSSVDALVEFCRNPRPYVNPFLLEPVCRIIVTGTESSGKTMISECLSWLFDTPVTSFITIYEQVKKDKYNTFAATILSEIIATIEDARYEEWRNLEAARIKQLETWQSSTLATLKKYYVVFSEYIRLKSEPGGKNNLATQALLQNINNFRKHLSFLPFLEDIDQCRHVLSTRDISEYAPASLTISPQVPAIPVLGDPDVTKAITAYIEANDLQKEIDPNTEDVMNIIVDNIESTDADAQNAHSTYGKYIIDGFPPLADYWNVLREKKILPDNTIAIIENREIEIDILKEYKQIRGALKSHKERFVQSSDPLVKIKLKQQEEHAISKDLKESKLFDVKSIVHAFVEAIIDDILIATSTDPEAAENEEKNAFTTSIDTFKEGWESIKGILEENFKSTIEVEINEMSDIEILDEVLHKLRESYCPPCEVLEPEEADDQEEEETAKDFFTFNDPRFLCETGTFCPIAFFDHSVLWEGKSEFSLKHQNKMYYFSKEECLERFKNDITKYQSYNKPIKTIPHWRICVMGPVGSGKSTISKFIAKELGLIYIDYEDAVNNFLMPRHFKKVGRRYENSFKDTPFDEEAVVEFQMDEENENLISDIMSNENELRRMVHNYFERSTPVLSVLVQKLLKKLWFEDPYNNIGIVLDGFPKIPNDVEDMAASFCIPDLIIELESNSEVATERVTPIMMELWKSQQNEAKDKEKRRFMQEKKEWTDFITKQVVSKVVFDDIVDAVMDVIKEQEPPEPVKSNESIVMDADGDDKNLNLITIYNEVIEQFPAPVSTVEWEKTADARDRINERVEAIFESDDEGIQSAKDVLSEQKIKYVAVNAARPFSKVSRKVLLKLDLIRGRRAIFEQTFIVSLEVANTLLSKGFYFLSRFSRLCPVYLYNNPNAIHSPYTVGLMNGTIFPVIHRCYIYYIYGKDAVIKFRSNPLKYIICDNIRSFHAYPLRIGVIGSPKSGKSSLSNRLAKQYGLKCVSRGKAIRSILENMHWTKLASKMTMALNEGDCVDYEHIVNAVQTVLIDYRTTVYGFVLDGFPEFPTEAMELEKAGIYPIIIFDVSSNRTTVLQNANNEVYYEIIKTMPPFSQSFIQYKYSKWSDKEYAIRDFVNNDCQNIFTLNGNISKWKCFQDSKDYIATITPKIHYYVMNVNSDLALPIDVLCISNDNFNKKCSSIGNLCAVCLKKKVLKHSSNQIDKKGLIQYKELYYWVCPEHMSMVLNDPQQHLANIEMLDIPEIPTVVKNFDPTMIYENGVCIVTYAENLPNQVIKTGSNKYSVCYKKRVYLLCQEKCFRKFLEKPHLYFDITIFKGIKDFPKVVLKKLPDIGYLEQTLGDLLTEACCAVNVVRPKYPGLDVNISALLYIALYLKVRNPLLNPSSHPLYKKILDVYEARSKYILALGLRLRSMDNPFVTYPKIRTRGSSNSGTVCKPSSFTSPDTMSPQSSQILPTPENEHVEVEDEDF